GKTGWREVEIGRGSSDATCPVVALQTWLKFARIERGPIFRRVSPDGKSVGADRLTDKHVARLVKQTAMAAGVRGDLSEGERAKKFSGHSLRAGLASSAEIDERYVQKQLGHTSAEMTRRYQRRDDRPSRAFFLALARRNQRHQHRPHTELPLPCLSCEFTQISARAGDRRPLLQNRRDDDRGGDFPDLRLRRAPSAWADPQHRAHDDRHGQ